MPSFEAKPIDRTIQPRMVPDSPSRRPPAGVMVVLLLLAGCVTASGGSDTVAQPDIRQHMTTNDLHIAEVAVQIAMERRSDNEASTWSNGLSGNYGAVVPRRTYRSRAGTFCRLYDEMITVAGVTATYQRTACRNEFGEWATIT